MYRKYQEGMRYLVFGALTTFINILSYIILYNFIHINNAISNVIAWIIGVIFAYITNKIYVFQSKNNTKLQVFREIISFVSCRIITLIIDEAIMIITVDKLSWNALLMKILANIIVIILNFIFSKILIFRKE